MLTGGGGLLNDTSLNLSPNSALKFVIITNFTHFYFFKASEFERLFYSNKDFSILYANFTSVNSLFKGNTDEFYKETQKILAQFNDDLKGFHLDTRQIRTNKIDFKSAQVLFKAFHKDFLLDEFNPNDANLLNERFYKELLYILGLQEAKQGGKMLIIPSNTPQQSTFYNAIATKLPNHNQDFESVMNFIVLWLNRILFLKLIEANLVRFNDDKSLKFLNLNKVPNFKVLSQLFFDILAKKPDERTQANPALAYLPYLNSSLFTRQKCEQILDISALDDSTTLAYYAHTQIKDKNAKAKSGQVALLAYLFEFLDSFDFGSNEDSTELALQKELISSSVLGLVFEKLNGYKEGSFYTPSFITSYMCRVSLEKVVCAKFNETNPQWNARTLADIEQEIQREIRQARNTPSLRKSETDETIHKENSQNGLPRVANNARNDIIKKHIKTLQSIRLCDPAVGSGHFLVSALNEMIRIYHALGLAGRINACDLRLHNDEIYLTKANGELYAYTKPALANDENHAIQKALFALKKQIIENNLFGVDINENSCEITKLRLWIELLKNSFYLMSGDEGFEENLSAEIHQMQTLPNIDINIKCGNSLVSYFDLKQSLNHYPNIKERMREYKSVIKDYKEGFFGEKARIEKEIKALKDSFRTFCFADKFKKEVKAFTAKCENYSKKYGNFLAKDDENLSVFIAQSFGFLEIDEDAARAEFKVLKKEYESIFNLENNKPFEWRFEFPEVLDEKGEFMGFDLVVGNPPYVLIVKEYRDYKKYKQSYKTASGGKINLYNLFFENSLKLIKQNGFLSFITPNTYLSSTDTKNLREILLNETSIYEIIEYTEKQKVFDNATQAVATIFLTNQKLPNHKTKLTTSKQGEQICLQNDLKKRNLLLATSPLILKIEQQKARLKDCFEIFQGEVNLTTKKQFYSFERGENRLLMWRGDNVGKYYPQSQPKEWCDKTASNSHYEVERIVMQQVSNQSQNFRTKAFISNKNFICGNSTNYLIRKNDENLLFYLGLINSQVFNFYFNYFSFTNHLTVSELERVPIPTINSKNSKITDEIINLVNQILVLKAENSSTDTSKLEKDIDNLIYKLYNLTPKEIEIIERR